MSQSVIATRPQEIVRSRWQHSGRLLLSLGLSLIMVWTLLFAFSRRTLAAPSETTLTQRAQNSALVTGSTITGTYGELLTVTLRFTVTANTVLTGPVRLTTQFPGVTTTANNQLGFRFISYTNPITISGVTPLTLTDFMSKTSGAAPYTTVITWTFDGITNTSGISSVYEVTYQVRYVWDGFTDSTTNVVIAGNSNLTSLVWGPGGTPNTKQATNALTINLRKPTLAPTKIYRLVPAMQGGATVVYTATLKNGTDTTNFSPAYDLVVTDSLDANLTYSEAFPTPTSWSSMPGQNTLITWTSPALAPNASWTAYVTATLPPTLTANMRYTNTLLSAYTTQPGDVPDEMSLTATASLVISGGIAASIQAAPSDNIRIGDTVTYTTRITLNQNVSMLTPIFSDTLAPGFHYRSGSLAVSGDAALSGAVVTSTGVLNEVLSWSFADWPPMAATRVATVTYIADLTGLYANGTSAYAATTLSLTNRSAGIDSLQAIWRDDQGRVYNLIAPVATPVQIIQPYLGSAGFGTGIFNWNPSGSPQEIGSSALYTFSVRNTGVATAYDVAVDDMLPPGLVYAGSSYLVVPPGTELWSQPSAGETALRFSLKSIAPNATLAFQFNALISDSVRPGDVLSNSVSVFDYSSQPGGKYDGIGDNSDYTGVYDRQYRDLSSAVKALPVPVSVTFIARGLIVATRDTPDPVLPGQLLTYSLSYSNTSAIASDSTLITHTYDALLTYMDSSSSPDVGSPISDTTARTLRWNAGSLGTNNASNSRITVTFQVAAPISRSVQALTSTVTSDSSSPSWPVARVVTTTLVQPKPTISLYDRGAFPSAGSNLLYTLIYSNTGLGTVTGTFTITLGYDPNITFVTSTVPYPVVGTGGTIFTATLTPGASKTVTLTTRVNQPLPYTLTDITSTATIYQPEADQSADAAETTSIGRPIFELVKVNTTPGNPAVGAGAAIGYWIDVTNTGTIAGNSIVITDVWDKNTWNQNPATGWVLYGEYGVYNIPTLAANGHLRLLGALNMNVTPTLPSNAQVIRNTAQLSSRDTTRQGITYDTPIAGLFIQKSHTPDPAYPDEVLTYTIVYTAYSNAISPVVTDTLPPEVTYLSCAGADSCAVSGGKVVWSWPTGLVAGDNGSLTLVVMAPITEGITLTNTYASDSRSGAPYREGDPDLTYVGRPHLSISKRATTAVDPNPIAPGDYITYTLTYTNSGSYKSTGTQAFDSVPANTTFYFCAGGTTCNPDPVGLVTWNLEEVSPITPTGTLTMVVRVNETANTPTIVNMTYYLTADRGVSSEGAPPSISTQVVQPILDVHKSASPTWVALGGFVTYTVQYSNTGGGTFTSINFTDTLYAGTEFVSASSSCAGSSTSNTVTCADLSGLAPADPARSFTLTVRSTGLSHGDVATNTVNYLAVHQTGARRMGTSNMVEVPAGNTANFIGTPLSGTFPLTVTFTNQSTGSGITGYLWDFGDGTTSVSSTTTVPHVYSQRGVYTVSLTVSPGSTKVRSAYISALDSPIGSLTALNSSPTRLDDATFFTATQIGGTNVGYVWNFRDGSFGSGVTTTHVYTSSGTYTAIVTATNSVSNRSTTTAVTITNQRPVAVASAAAVSPGLVATLDGSLSADPDNHYPLTHFWAQTGGSSVIFTPNLSVTTFTAPNSTTVLTFTLTVTDAHGLSSLSAPVTVTINDVSITGLTAQNSSPTGLGNSTQFTATITAGSSVNYTWNFGDGFTTTGRTAAHDYTAAGNFAAIVTATNTLGSAFATTPVTITRATPVVTITAHTPITSVVGENVTISVTVTSPVITPTGTITVTAGAQSCSAPVATGQCAIAFTSSGVKTLTAQYSGDANFISAASSNVTHTVSPANAANTTTSLTSAPNPSIVSQVVTFTATVTVVAPGTGTPIGTVTFTIGSASTPIALIGGAATYTTSMLAVGVYSVTAVYGGEVGFNGSASSVYTHTVSPASSVSTTISLASAPNPSSVSQTVIFTATVTAVAGTPGGTVTFTIDGAQVGTSALIGGAATYSASTLTVGEHSVTAAYGGEAGFNGSASSVYTHTVSPANLVNTTTSLTSAPNPSIVSRTVTFTATVTAVAPGTGTPGGTVTFTIGSASTPIALSGGVATYSTSTLAVGVYSVTAAYGGDVSFNGSASGPINQTVNQVPDYPVYLPIVLR